MGYGKREETKETMTEFEDRSFKIISGYIYSKKSLHSSSLLASRSKPVKT